MLFLIISIGYVVAVVVRWVIWWNAVGGLTIPPLRPEFESLTFGNPSHVLMMVALLAVPAAAGVSWATRRGVAWLVTVLGLIALVALLSGSRAGWLALAVAGVFAVVLGAVLVGPRLRTFVRTSPMVATRRFRLAVGAGVVALAVPVVVLAPAVLRRASEGGEDLRLSYVAIALRMFQESPVVGTGLGTWVVQRIAYTVPPEIDYYIPHAHNVYAQTLAEQGVVGAIAGLLVVVWLAWLVRDAIRSEGTRRQVGVATAIGLMYFAAHQALDFNVNLPSVLFALALPDRLPRCDEHADAFRSRAESGCPRLPGEPSRAAFGVATVRRRRRADLAGAAGAGQRSRARAGQRRATGRARSAQPCPPRRQIRRSTRSSSPRRWPRRMPGTTPRRRACSGRWPSTTTSQRRG